MDAGKINKIDQSLQLVIIAYQHNAGKIVLGDRQDELAVLALQHIQPKYKIEIPIIK